MVKKITAVWIKLVGSKKGVPILSNHNQWSFWIHLSRIWMLEILILVFSQSPVFAGDIENKLSTNDGSTTFEVRDSGDSVVSHIDSDGNMVIKGGLRLDSGGVECTTSENLIVDGNLGVGTAIPTWKLSLQEGTGFVFNFPNANRTLNIQRRTTSTNTNDDMGVKIFTEIVPSGAVSGKEYYAVSIDALADTSYSLGGIVGIEGRAYQYGSGDTNLTAICGVAKNKGTAIISNAASLYAEDIINDGGGTITNAYGLYIEPITSGNNRYDIYAGGPTSYFDGKIGIGTTEPNSKLNVNGSFAVKRTATSTDYTSVDEVIIGVTDTSLARTVTLASADAVAGRIIIIKDESGGAGTNNITIATEGTETIDSANTASITTSYGVVRLYSNGSNWFKM